MEMLTERQMDQNGQTKREIYINLKGNLAMMVIYFPIKFELGWTKHFRVRVQKRNVDGQING